MDSLTLLAEARAAGLEVRADGDKLVVRGRTAAEPLALALLAHKAELMPLLAPPAPPLSDWLAQEPPRVHQRVLAARRANDVPALRAALGAQSEALEAFLLEGEHALTAAGQNDPDYPRGLQRWQRALTAYEALEQLRAALSGQHYDRLRLAEWCCSQLWQAGDVAGCYEAGAAYLESAED